MKGVVDRVVRAHPLALDVSASFALSCVLTLALLSESITSLDSPVDGGDALSHYATGFFGRADDRFGYPFGMHPFAYFPNTDLTQRLIATAIHALTGDRILSVNLVWVLSFPLTAVAAWWVLRLAGSGRLLAISLSASFAFVPYHILRGTDHIYLAAMWSVPLAVGLSLLTGHGRIPLLLERGRRGQVTCLTLCLLIAWSGIYYAFFAGLLLVIALGWLFSQGASRRTLAQSAIPLAIVFGAVMTVMLGAAIANAIDPPSSLVASRQPSESALYAGNLAFALSPSPLTDVPIVANRAARFQPYVQPGLEGHGYGQFGTVVTTLSALVLVMGLLMRRRRWQSWQSGDQDREPGSGLYLALLCACLLFFVPWGLNFSFALLATPEIRSWDRLLPVILLLLMLGAVSVLRDQFKAISRTWRVIVAATILLLTVMEGVTPYVSLLEHRYQAGGQRVHWGSDYAALVNRSTPERCGVLQLPYVPFPEKAERLGRMEDYEHFLVALTNPDKQWSYGGVKYTTASHWAHRLSDNLTDASVDALVEGGFCGIHLDVSGYTRAAARELSASLHDQLGPPVAVGHGGRWQFYKLPVGDSAPRDVRDRKTLSPATSRLFYPSE
jgi:phosphoglycerol transferase